MDVRTDSKDGATVAPTYEPLKSFQDQTKRRIDGWIQQLQDDPDSGPLTSAEANWRHVVISPGQR